jgi:hypothetical protein
VDHRFNRIIRLSPREWVTAYFVLSPVTGWFATVASRITDAFEPGRVKRISTKLDASIGAPEPHDFAVRARLRRVLRRASCRPAEFVESS